MHASNLYDFTIIVLLGTTSKSNRKVMKYLHTGVQHFANTHFERFLVGGKILLNINMNIQLHAFL